MTWPIRVNQKALKENRAQVMHKVAALGVSLNAAQKTCFLIWKSFKLSPTRLHKLKLKKVGKVEMIHKAMKWTNRDGLTQLWCEISTTLESKIQDVILRHLVSRILLYRGDLIIISIL